jgi:hypothetical protein
MPYYACLHLAILFVVGSMPGDGHFRVCVGFAAIQQSMMTVDDDIVMLNERLESARRHCNEEYRTEY